MFYTVVDFYLFNYGIMIIMMMMIIFIIIIIIIIIIIYTSSKSNFIVDDLMSLYAPYRSQPIIIFILLLLGLACFSFDFEY